MWRRKLIVSVALVLVAGPGCQAPSRSSMSGAATNDPPDAGVATSTPAGDAAVGGALKDPTGALTGTPDKPPSGTAR
jgi:hypothetical protein